MVKKSTAKKKIKTKTKKTKKSKFIDKTIPKKEILKVLKGSTKFKMEITRVILRFDRKFLSKFLTETAKDIEKGRIIQISEGSNVIVVLCEESFAKEMKRKYKKHIIEMNNDLVAFTIMFPKVGTETHGILSFITTILAENKVNLFEVISAYTDITFVIKKEDLFKVMDLLGQFIV